MQFGWTARTVSRLGLASAYGVSTAAIKDAFHKQGVNYRRHFPASTKE